MTSEMFIAMFDVPPLPQEQVVLDELEYRWYCAQRQYGSTYEQLASVMGDGTARAYEIRFTIWLGEMQEGEA